MRKEKDESKKGFSYWFENVFLYHYGKWALAAVIAIAVVVFITISGTKKEKYDFQMGLIVSGGIMYDDTEELRELVADAVGDLDGNKKTVIDLQIVNLGDLEYAEANQYKVMLLMSQPEYTLFILDEDLSSLYCSKEYFDDLTQFGITPDEKFSSRVDVTECAPLKNIGAGFEYYACLADWTTVGKGSAAQTEAAIRVIKALTEN